MGKEVDTSELSGVLFEASADAIVVVDADGRIVLANAACEELLGYDGARAHGPTPADARSFKVPGAR